MIATPDLMRFLQNAVDPRLIQAAELLDRQGKLIADLVAAVEAGIMLQGKLLDEILHLHATAQEPLPMGLIEAKHAFDQTIASILGRH